MRYELTDFEWTAIKPFLPNKPRGVPRVNDRRVLNGIFWILRSGAAWRDRPKGFGPYTTCYNRFVRWRMAGIWDGIMEAFAKAHDSSVQMIDTSIVRVHQHGGCAGGRETRLMGRSRGGLTTKIHACVDTNGLPIRLELTTGEAHDNRLVTNLLSDLKSGAMLLADRGYAQIGSGHSPVNTVRGPTFLQSEIAESQSALAHICTGRAIWLSVSSTRSSNVGVLRPDTTNSPQTTSPSSNWHQSEFGYALMSSRPSFRIPSETGAYFVRRAHAPAQLGPRLHGPGPRGEADRAIFPERVSKA
jgi:transposase